MKNLKYPIGEFQKPALFSQSIISTYIKTINDFPKKINGETKDLSNKQLDTPYREGGWSIRQVVNHCADSHINALIRVKLALTEDTPTIKPYAEARWAELADSLKMPIQPALEILSGVHQRWVILLNSLKDNDWKKSFIHPEKGRALTLEESTGMYAWHCDHHLAHITELKKRMDW